MTKKIIIFSLLIIFNFTFLNFASAVDCPPGNTASQNTAICNPNSNFFVDLTRQGIGLPDNSFGSLLLFVIRSILAIVGLVAMGFIIFGGFQYITSRGDEEQALSGKKSLTNAIIGLVIIILSYVIVTVIANALMGRVR